MKRKYLVSAIQFYARQNDKTVQIQLPNSDLTLFGDADILDEFIAEHGDKKVVIKSESKSRLYLVVPEFKQGIDEFVQAKLACLSAPAY